MTADIDTKDPKFLAFWTKCIRESSKWSQEALAAASGLTVRTIQRIEAGNAVNITTRRALARGLGYDDPDVFENPGFIKGVQALFDGMRKVQDESCPPLGHHKFVKAASAGSDAQGLNVRFRAIVQCLEVAQCSLPHKKGPRHRREPF